MRVLAGTQPRSPPNNFTRPWKRSLPDTVYNGRVANPDCSRQEVASSSHDPNFDSCRALRQSTSTQRPTTAAQPEKSLTSQPSMSKNSNFINDRFYPSTYRRRCSASRARWTPSATK
ncbi:hypothetical protein Q1695_013020 [Nippostrongylus brasiliensis]|nr:hypothetical protein Q1695_013020 [Nippostrongylus brasiliensis]